MRAASSALEEQQRKGEGRLAGELLSKAREAAQAARASERWAVLMAAQHLIGRMETAPKWKEMQQELHRRRERLMQQELLIKEEVQGKGCGRIFVEGFQRGFYIICLS